VKPAYDDGNVEVLHVQGNVHLVAGSGANITVQVAPDGLLVVDSSVAAMSEKVVAAIGRFQHKLIRHIINTSADERYTGGKSLERRTKFNAGVGGQNGRETARLDGADHRPRERPHRMSGLRASLRACCGVAARHLLYKHEAAISAAGRQMLHAPAACDGDVMVWFQDPTWWRRRPAVHGDVSRHRPEAWRQHAGPSTRN
jgi:hypothetical protein